VKVTLSYCASAFTAVPKGEQIVPFDVQFRPDRILAMNVTNLARVLPRPIGWKGRGALAQRSKAARGGVPALP